MKKVIFLQALKYKGLKAMISLKKKSFFKDFKKVRGN